MMTNEKFIEIPAGRVFDAGAFPNNEQGLYMSDNKDGAMLGWVAKKGHGDDWCIYCDWSHHTVDWILRFGQKVRSEKNIRRCVHCDDTVFSKYRY